MEQEKSQMKYQNRKTTTYKLILKNIKLITINFNKGDGYLQYRFMYCSRTLEDIKLLLESLISKKNFDETVLTKNAWKIVHYKSQIRDEACLNEIINDLIYWTPYLQFLFFPNPKTTNQQHRNIIWSTERSKKRFELKRGISSRDNYEVSECS